MTMLATHALSKRFPGVVALDHVDFEAQAGEVRAVVGANGAGKSTFMNILAGVLPPTSGEIRLDGRTVAIDSPRTARELGISVVFQEFSSIPELTVEENIYLGREPRSRLNLIDRQSLRESSTALLARYHLDLLPGAPVGRLSIAQRQHVELARALSTSARILILDEPTAVLSARDWDNLFGIIGGLKRARLLVLYVSHRLEEVFAVADRITVLRNGRAVATRPAAESSYDDLVRLMTGSETRRVARSTPPARVDPALLNVSFDRADSSQGLRLQRGEILGIAGLVGSGRTSIARSLVGLVPGAEPRVEIDGSKVWIRSPRQALRHGIAYLTEDRKSDGLFGALSVVLNTSAAALEAYSPWGMMQRSRERAGSEAMLRQLRLVARSLDMPVAELSGGNQQKVVMARALLALPRILICDEPTRGIDVQAKAEIYGILLDLAAKGVGIILISAEFGELLALTHRLLVIRDGRFVAEMITAEIDEHALLAAAIAAPAAA